jgi:signal transduction histidine kinase
MKKILVIDDALPVREGIAAILGLEGFEVIQAENGLIGIQLARDYLPDLIICDIIMPELNGYDTLAILRQDPTTAAIPFIFLTAKVSREDMRRGMNIGADDYLSKPFTTQELLSAVKTRLEKQEVVLKRSEKKLEDLRGNIIHALPHEFLTPLHGILGFSELLMENYETVGRQEIGEMAQMIHLSATNLHKLIQNFLVYAQIELIATDPKRIAALRNSVTEHPRMIISEVCWQKAKQLEREKDLALELTDTKVQISEENLKKVIEELISNAFKFSQAGTPVHVTTTTLNHFFIIEINNFGRGMTSQQIADIGAYMQFERKFYEQQGTGLGLIIAKRLVELHGGSLTIQSIPSQKTTVYVKLKRSISL